MLIVPLGFCCCCCVRFLPLSSDASLRCDFRSWNERGGERERTHLFGRFHLCCTLSAILSDQFDHREMSPNRKDNLLPPCSRNVSRGISLISSQSADTASGNVVVQSLGKYAIHDFYQQDEENVGRYLRYWASYCIPFGMIRQNPSFFRTNSELLHMPEDRHRHPVRPSICASETNDRSSNSRRRRRRRRLLRCVSLFKPITTPNPSSRRLLIPLQLLLLPPSLSLPSSFGIFSATWRRRRI